MRENPYDLIPAYPTENGQELRIDLRSVDLTSIEEMLKANGYTRHERIYSESGTEVITYTLTPPPPENGQNTVDTYTIERSRSKEGWFKRWRSSISGGAVGIELRPGRIKRNTEGPNGLFDIIIEGNVGGRTLHTQSAKLMMEPPDRETTYSVMLDAANQEVTCVRFVKKTFEDAKAVITEGKDILLNYLLQNKDIYDHFLTQMNEIFGVNLEIEDVEQQVRYSVNEHLLEPVVKQKSH
jgi:hypothetical protein